MQRAEKSEEEEEKQRFEDGDPNTATKSKLADIKSPGPDLDDKPSSSSSSSSSKGKERKLDQMHFIERKGYIYVSILPRKRKKTFLKSERKVDEKLMAVNLTQVMEDDKGLDYGSIEEEICWKVQ